MGVDGDIENNESIAGKYCMIMNILASLLDMIEMTSIYKWHKDQCGHIVDQSYVHIKEKERPSNLEEPFIWTH